MLHANGIFAMTPELVQTAIKNKLCNQPCTITHQGGCNLNSLLHFKSGCASAYKLYFIAHIIPFLIFKRKKFAKNPKEQTIKFLMGFIKSLLFAGGYTAIWLRASCFLINNYKSQGDVCSIISSIVAGLTLIFQPIGRQTQIALFCMNKSIQTAYNMGLRRNLYKSIAKGQCFVMGLSSAILLYHFTHNKEAIRFNYLWLLNLLFAQI